jgi:hypothetical protein
MKAWLITRGAGEVAALKGYEIVDILSARKSDEDLRQYVQRLHDLSCLTLSERAEQARYNRKNCEIYRAELHYHTLPGAPKIGGVIPTPDPSRSPQVLCGHSPSVFAAQRVKKLLVERDAATGRERVTWEPWTP